MRGFRERADVDAATAWIDALPSSLPTETVALDAACGRVLAEDLVSAVDVPTFPRAAMDVELKRGRGAVNRFLDATYGGDREWTRSPVHDWLRAHRPPYVIDINRDTQLQDSYAGIPHTLVRGIARIGGTDYRFRIDHYDGKTYRQIDQTEVDTDLPVLFKPMGSPTPDATYIASDADYVDYITELMGGFAIPDFLKLYRRQRQYLFLGMRLLRDTERMVLADMIYAAGVPAGYSSLT